MVININKLKAGQWIYNTSGVYEIVKIYEAAEGKLYKVKEVLFDPKNDEIFTLGEEYDMTREDVKHCEMFFC